MRLSVVVTVAALLVSRERVCLAEPASPTCRGSRPWVLITGDVPASLLAQVTSELVAGLRPSNIDVCPAGPASLPEPLSRVTLTASATSGTYRLDVFDSVTQKRVGRDISLSELPPDGRPLAIAVAAEELLRASWAELALRGVRSSGNAPLPEVRAVVETPARPAALAPRGHAALGARLAFEHFLGGQTHYGGDAFASLPLGPAAAFLALGGRRALSTQATHGSIEASALSAETGVSFSFVRQGALDVGAFASVRLLHMTFVPAALPSGAGERQSGFALTSRAGLSFAFGRRGVLRSYSTAGAGVPLRSYSAADAGSVVTGASKLELLLSTGLAFEFP